MYQKERMDRIMELLERHGYVSVRFLTEQLHYSTATINRDLNLLEQMERVKRSYGGVEVTQPRTVPVVFRYEKSKSVKKRLAKRAAEFVRDGDRIFIDGSTTAQYMGEYLLEKKDLTVMTNNMALAIFLADVGVRVTVLGGSVLEPPYMLAGTDTQEAASRYRADKCFFATYAVSREGELSYTDDIYYAMHKAMIRNSREVFYLADAQKLDKDGGRVVLGDLSPVDFVISDCDFPAETRSRFAKTTFVEVGGRG